MINRKTKLSYHPILGRLIKLSYLTTITVILQSCVSFTITQKSGKPLLIGNNGKEECEVKHSQRVWSAFYGVWGLGDKSLQGVSFEENHVYQFKEKYEPTEVLTTLILGLVTSVTVKKIEVEDCGIIPEQKIEIKQIEIKEE
ncbi:MAG: hypothetical protein IPL26_20985 [Leptospiraceae bacterium]|nr:hypothetical protein [Leptospiraceae bacterium]